MSDLSRRAMLCGIPSVATVAIVPVAVAAGSSADAAIVALAARIVVLAKESDDAEIDVATRDDRLTALEPPRPSVLRNTYRPEWETVDTIRRKIAKMEANCIVRADLVRRLPAIGAWEAECAAISERLGIPAALERSNQINSELFAELAHFTDMQPTTIAGLGAKADALIALESWNGADEHKALSASLLADVRRIAGGEHV